MAIQIVELHYAAEPSCDYAAIHSRAQAFLGEDLDAPDASWAKNSFLLFHKQYPIQFEDAVTNPRTALLRANKPMNLEAFAEDIQQSWRFRDCSAVLAKSRHTLLVAEMMAQSLPPLDRVRLFHGVLQAVIEATEPDALVFKDSQQVVNPQDYLERTEDSPILRPGSLNVRFFDISNSPGDMLMDTRGLTEVGLHDLQCHFRELDQNEVSRVLFSTAVYIFENGAVIESGHTVAGIEDGSRWVCQFEESLVPPAREVLDLNPGAPFAAGNRH